MDPGYDHESGRFEKSTDIFLSLFKNIYVFIIKRVLLFYFILAMHTSGACHFLQDFTILNINLTACRMLIMCFENSTLVVIISWSVGLGQYFARDRRSGSGRVAIWQAGSQKWTRARTRVEPGHWSPGHQVSDYGRVRSGLRSNFSLIPIPYTCHDVSSFLWTNSQSRTSAIKRGTTSSLSTAKI